MPPSPRNAGAEPASVPSRLMTRNGIATKVAATTAPEVWNGSMMPKVSSSQGPSSAAPAEAEQQRDTADGRRQHHRQQHQ